jgi:D-alanyl-D-alanine carboxypeptidase/D-alanyl-D-alanine-endopeptidase (penicillin-binding protein 4)
VRGSKIITGFLLFFCCSIFYYPIQAQNIVNSEIKQIIDDSRADHAFWSVIVRDTTGKILTGYNHDKLVRPASNLKLLTSAAILDELGPDYRYSTKMYGWGEQQGDTWKGDIIIRGAGDPSISGDFYHDDRFYVFEKMFKALKDRGIKKIDGNLIGNDSFFDQQPYPEGWSWQDLSFYYGVEISALSFNNNAVDLTVYADGEVGDTPDIEWFPFDTDYVEFVNEQVITPPGTEYDEFYRRLLGTNTILLRSKLPREYLEKESLSIKNASGFFLDTFKKYLSDGGIQLNGRIIVDSQPQNWKQKSYSLLAEHQSVPLRQLLAQVNKESDNFYTEMLLKTMAAEHFNAAGSTELGISLVKDFAESMHMDTSRVELVDGAGMAPSTLLTVQDLSQMLVEMRNHPYFETYKNSLSVAGVDGSFKNRLGSELKRKFFGKTGYVSGVRSLSGYLKTASGQLLIVSVVTNNYAEKTSYIDYLQEKIVRTLYKTF